MLKRDARGRLSLQAGAATATAPRYAHLSSALNDLVAARAQGALATAAHLSGAELDGDLVMVTIVAQKDGSQAVADAMAAAGGRVTTRFQDQLDAFVPASALPGVGNLNAVVWIDLPSRPMPSAFPQTLSEALPLMNVSAWKYYANFSGNGVKVGVIDSGFLGYPALLGTRLPTSVDTSCSQVDPLSTGSVHGTAVTEILRDVAPNATFYIAAVSTSTQLGAAESCLAAAGVSVINHSEVWNYDGPGDGTGLIERVVDDAVAKGVFWVNSAGNEAKLHWSGPWRDLDGSGLLDFVSGGDKFNRISIPAGGRIVVSLRWDDPFGSACNDFDIGLVQMSTQTVVAAARNGQGCGLNPLEGFEFPNAAPDTYGITVSHVNPAKAANFDLMVFAQNSMQYTVAADSIASPVDSSNPGMVAVGAVAWNNPSTLESFSSQGPTHDGRVKPDIVGPDGVSTTTYGTLNFSGTSASAPHVAGAAALIKQANPGFGPTDIRNVLLGNAVTLGTTAFNSQFGAGRLDLGVPPGGCGANRPTISVTASQSAPGTLQVSLTPSDSNIRLRSVQFGDRAVNPNSPVNTLIDLMGLTGLTGNFTTQLPNRPSALQFVARKSNPGGAMTAPIDISDGCGVWPTLIGAGAGV